MKTMSSDLRRTRGGQILPALIILLILAVGYSTVSRSGPHSIAGRTWGSTIHRCDFSVYTAAGRAALAGSDIYQAQNSRGWFYVYPPPFALLIVPFAVVPLFWASLVWYILSVVMIIAAARLLLGMMGPVELSREDRIWLALLPAGLVLWLLISALQHGQTTPLVLWLAMAALSQERSGHNLKGGLALAGAALIKVFPVLLLGYFIFRRKWRMIASTFAALIVLGLLFPSAFFGVRTTLAYWAEWGERVAFPAVSSRSAIESSPLNSTLLDPASLNNQSLTAVLWRITGSDKGRVAAVVILAAMGALTAFLGRHRRDGAEAAVAGGFIAWMVLAPPVSWSHYFSMLILPLTFLVLLARRGRDRSTRMLATYTLVLFAVCCSSSAIALMKFYGLLCWTTVGLWAAMMILTVRLRIRRDSPFSVLSVLHPESPEGISGNKTQLKPELT